MLNADVLTLREFAMRETLPLATIQETVFEFLRGRTDIALFGAQAVNAYVAEPRMTQDIDLLSTRAPELADELRNLLSEHFHIAVRVREIGAGRGYRIYQVRKEGNRHLLAIRPVEKLPAVEMIDEINILTPAELIASKVIAWHARRGKPKAGTDWRDLAMLLLKFPALKNENGAVAEILARAGSDIGGLQAWREIVAQNIEAESEDEDLNY